MYDLSGLHLPQGSYQLIGSGYTYNINICGSLTGSATCPVSSQASICQSCCGSFYASCGDGIGSFSMMNNVLTLTVSTSIGSFACSNRQSIILFYCDANVGVGAPLFLQENPTCVYSFSWTTVYACPR